MKCHDPQDKYDYLFQMSVTIEKTEAKIMI